MRRMYRASLIGLVLVIAMISAACGGGDADDTTTTEAAAQETTTTTVVEFDLNASVNDYLSTRETSEYGEGHVPGAVSIPLRTLGANLDKIPTDRQVYVYCKSGFRAAQALSSLGMLGYDNVLSYKPGWNGWTEAGQDVSTEAAEAEVVGAPDIAPELVAAVNGFLSTIPEGWLSAGGAEDVQAALDAGAIALDVRTAGEYAEGNVQGSLNIDLRELAVGIEGVSTSANVITYCGSGHRSAMALAALQVLGADNIKAYGGSYTSLVDAGLPIATP